MGCIYCGYDSRRRKNGHLKIGMTTSSTPDHRFSACSLDGLWYLRIKGATKTELLFLESVARLTGEKAGLKLRGNDYFDYPMNHAFQPQKYHDAAAISHPICKAVACACDNLHLSYKLITY